jgi:hypothetical protein
MIWGYQLRLSMPSPRSHKGSGRRKRGLRWPQLGLPGAPRGPRGSLSAPNFGTVLAPRAPVGKLPGQSEARSQRRSIGSSERSPVARTWGPGAPGGEGAHCSPPRRPTLPTAAPRPWSPRPPRPPRPAPRGGPPAGRPAAPGQRSSGEPPARACGLVGVT